MQSTEDVYCNLYNTYTYFSKDLQLSMTIHIVYDHTSNFLRISVTVHRYYKINYTE